MLFSTEIQNRTSLGKEATRRQLPNRSSEQLDFGHGAPYRPVIVIPPAGNPGGSTLSIPKPIRNGTVIDKMNTKIANLNHNACTTLACIQVDGFKGRNPPVGIASVDDCHSLLLTPSYLRSEIYFEKTALILLRKAPITIYRAKVLYNNTFIIRMQA
jgi:hypothetical protein